MKILGVSTSGIETPPPAYGGMERIFAWLVRGLREFGHEVDVLCKTGSTIEGAMTGDSETDFVELVKASDQTWDVVIDFSHDKLIGRTFTDLPQINTYQVMTISHNVNPVFISQAQQRHIGVLGTVIYYGLDLLQYPYYSGPRDDYLLYMGSLIEEKRVHWVAELANITGHRAIICGPRWQPEYWPVLDKMAEMPNVEVRDEVGGEEKLDLLQRAKCLVHPVGGKNWVEAGAIVVLEALAVGTPVIASVNGCLPEYISNGLNGFLCSNVPEMAQVLPKVGQILTKHCTLSVQHYNYQRMTTDYLRLVDKILS